MDIFSGVDFSLSAGEALIVTGPNGAGKSTLLRIARRPACRPSRDGARSRGPATPTPAGALPLSRPSRRHEDGADAAREPPLLAAVLRRAGLPRTSARRVGARRARRPALGTSVRPASVGGRRWPACSSRHRPLWLLDEPTAGARPSAEGELAALVAGIGGRAASSSAATHAPLDLADAAFLPLAPSG